MAAPLVQAAERERLNFLGQHHSFRNSPAVRQAHPRQTKLKGTEKVGKSDAVVMTATTAAPLGAFVSLRLPVVTVILFVIPQPVPVRKRLDRIFSYSRKASR